MKVAITTLALVLGTLVVPCRVASAEDVKAVKKVEDLNRAAMEDYDLLEFESAKRQLTDALTLVKKSKLDKNLIAARAHMSLGIVYGGGLNDQGSALTEFVAALEIDSTLKLDAAYKTPALQRLFEQARAAVTGGRTPADTKKPIETKPIETKPVDTKPVDTKPVDTKPAEVVSGLKHTPIEDATAGQMVPISAKVGADVKAKQVALFYRPAGAEKFVSAPMTSTNGVDYEAQIPAKAVGGASVHYYIEAKGASGKVVATAGNEGAPNIISIAARKATPDKSDAPDDENPLDKKPQHQGGDGAAGTGDTGDTQVTATAGPPKKPRFFLGVSVGSGGGYVNGETEVSHQAVTCCVAVAPFHIMPELGMWVAPNMTVSLYGRIGFPLGANVVGAATAAPAVFARVGYFFGKDGHAGLYVHGDLGGGFIRHIIKLKSSSATAVQGDTDTYATGPLFIGGGGGWVKHLGGPLRFVVELNIEAGIPVVDSIGDPAMPIKPGFAVNADLNLGFSFAF